MVAIRLALKMVMIMIGAVVPYIGDTFLYGRRSLRS